MGENTNCDLMHYVKKEANHVGPILEARLYTHQSTFDVSRQLAERGEACLVRPLPRPRARWLAGRGENFTTPSVYSSSLPWLERSPYCLKYLSFIRFQYELLVHTPNTDVYRCILECRFTHFAPYGNRHNSTHSPSPRDPRPRGGRATIHSVSNSQNDIYCNTIIARLPEEAKSQAQG